MVWVLYVTFDALAQEANLWPIVLILTSPVALAYVLTVLTAAYFVARARQKREKATV
jgi:hypothetical protein